MICIELHFFVATWKKWKRKRRRRKTHQIYGLARTSLKMQAGWLCQLVWIINAPKQYFILHIKSSLSFFLFKVFSLIFNSIGCINISNITFMVCFHTKEEKKKILMEYNKHKSLIKSLPSSIMKFSSLSMSSFYIKRIL